MRTISIRGATTIENNSKNEILDATKELIEVIIVKNAIRKENITSIVFTATKDITKIYPAVAARELDLTKAALMCTQEMYVEKSLEKCIRVMVQVSSHTNPAKHVYLRRAKKLRPDLLQSTQVAIDGPAGAGKSTIAKKVADKLDYVYIDTGAMYRAVAYYCHNQNIDINNEADVIEQLDNIDIEITNNDGDQIIHVNNKNITTLIRTPEISSMASIVAVYNDVREKMVDIQREISDKQSVVMDGRDIGTHVLPNAQLKIFLTATVLERSKRRFEDLKKKGYDTNLEEISKEIKSRDYNDINREISPLKKANDSIEVDTTGKSIEEVVKIILNLV